MKLWFLALFIPFLASAQVKTESFVVQIYDRSMKVISPEKRRDMFAVLLENHSLSDQIGKFTVGNKTLKFVTVESGKSESVEIENKTSHPVMFVPLSPASQEIPLQFGKKAYEIPSKE